MSTPAPNIFDTLAQQDTQRMSHDQSVAPQKNVFDQIADNNGQPPATPPATQQPEGALSRFASGVADPFKSIYHGATDDPQDVNEITAHTQGGQGGLIAYRMAKQLMAAHEAMVGSTGDGFRKAAQDFKNSAIDMILGNKKDAIMHGLSGGISAAQGAEPAAAGALERPHELSEGATAGGDLATPLGKTAADVGMIAATEGVGRAVSAVRGAGEAGKVAEGAGKPGVVRRTINEVRQGPKVAQEPAKAAIRSTVDADEDATLLEGNKTVIDEHLKGIGAKEKAAYKAQDDAAGFDVKETRAKLKDAEWKVKQPEIDDATRERLTKTISESKQSITDAEGKLKEAGVDPKQADTLHQQRMAGQDFKKALIQNVSPDGESVNVDSLLNASKKLRFSKYGDRLEQFMGKEGADSFMQELEKAQKAGVHGLKTQKIAVMVAKWVAGGIVGGGAAGLGYELLK